MKHLREWMGGVNDLLNAMSVLNWNARVVMPPGGSETRGKQLATLAQVVQERFTSDTTRRLLEAAEGDVSGLPEDAYEVREVRQAREALETLARVPLALTAELTRLKSVAQPVWAEAKAAKDYAQFAPYLKRMSRCLESWRTPSALKRTPTTPS